MSWIVGYWGPSLSREMRERLASLHGGALHVSEGKNFYVACGGIPETCQFSRSEDDQYGWSVTGVGISAGERHCHILTTSDWRQRLTSERARLDGLGGHYVAVRWREEALEAYTDLLGIRTLYIADINGGRVISTRLDWLATLLGGCSIDYGAFGSHWLAVNQLGARSFCRGIHKVEPGSYLRLDSDGMHRAELDPRWLFAMERQEDTDPLRDTIRSFLYPDDPRTISLGLSGGIDSRLLLALRASHAGFVTHTFGASHRVDVRIASKVAAAANVAHSHIALPVPSATESISLLRSHATLVHAASPASACIDLRYFSQLRLEGRLLVDGGFGEIVRRQFLNRLYHRESEAVVLRDASRMLAHMRCSRADVFTAETNRIMHEGAIEDLASTIARLPSPDDVGIENFLDALSVRTRLPHFFGFEQARLDHLVLNYMPYAQPAVIQQALATPPEERRGGRFARSVILNAAPRLGRIALAKGAASYPFRSPPLAIRLLTAARERFGSPREDQTRAEFLAVMKEYALDRAHSSDVRQHGAYDVRKLVRLVDGYYSGDVRLGAGVDWWLAFEMWRATIEKPHSDVS